MLAHLICSPIRYLLALVLFAALHLAAGKLGVALSFMAGNVSAVWPPAGLSVAVLYLFGYRLWPGAWIGAFVVSLGGGIPMPVAVMLGAGNAIEAMLAVWLIRRFQGDRPWFETVRGVIVFAGLGAAVSSTTSATIGTTSLALAGIVPPAAWMPVWQTWWLGDTTGILLLAPVIVTWASDRTIQGDGRMMVEAAALLAVIGAAVSIIFGSTIEIEQQSLAYAVFPLLIAAALRFGIRGAATAALIISVSALLGTLEGGGPFGTVHLSSRLVVLQTFMGVVVVTALVLAAAMNERQRAEDEARRSESKLREAQRIAGLAWYEFLPKRDTIRFSSQLNRILGLRRDGPEMTRARFLAMVHPDDRDQVIRFRRQQDEQTATTAYRVVRPDGETRYLYEEALREFDAAGAVEREFGIQLDVTEHRRVAEALRASEAKFRSYVENALEGIFVCDQDGRYLEVNPAACRLLGYSEGEFRRLRVADLVAADPTSAAPSLAHFERLLAMGRSEGEIVLCRRDGSHVLCDIGAVALGNGRYLGVVRDVTERRRAEQALEESRRQLALRNLLLEVQQEVSPDGILAVDPAGVVISHNKRFVEMWRLPEEAICSGSRVDINRLLQERLAVDQAVPQSDDEARPNPNQRLSERVALRDGRVFERHSSGMIGEDGTAYGRVWFYRDVTDRARYEQELREEREQVKAQARHIMEVAERLAVARRDAEHARRAAEEASRAKSQFLAAMSHELRTPLNAILGFSEIIRSQAFGPDAVDKYVEYANDVHVSGVHLLDLINDLLDVSKIEAGKMELSPEWLALPALLEASLRLVRVRAEQHNVMLELDLPERVPSLYADERAVKQIVFNLLSNAVKFTPEGGRVTVDVTDTMDNGIQIRVTDTGIGIPQDQIDRAFRPFEQIHPAASWAMGGTGLGLALVKGLVEQHGGTVHIDSKVNAGTTVTVRFPPGPAAVAYARTGAA